MPRRFLATVFVLSSLFMAVPSWAVTDLDHELWALRWQAVPAGTDPVRYKRLCVCTGSGEKGAVGRLVYTVINSVPLKFPVLGCEVRQYDENTEEVVNTPSCDEWFVLPR